MLRAHAIAAGLALALTAGCGGKTTATGGRPDPNTDPSTGPAAGWAGGCTVPAEGQPEPVTASSTVIGDGTPASCTGDAVVAAVARGGTITFDCGPDPVVIKLAQPATVINRADERIVIDGGGRVTLSGAGRTRILYMNTCEERLNWLTPRCDDQEFPQLTVQNLTFVDGDARGQGPEACEGCGGAIYAQGGRLKIVNARFFHNQGEMTGPDVGGGAVRAFEQWRSLPVHVVGSTFGGSSALANVASNGAALSSIGVSWTVVNSLFVDNAAVGWGANPRRDGTPGGGSGGAVYMDGNRMTLSLCGVRMAGNTATEGGGAVFYVSNVGNGAVTIDRSELVGNPSRGFETSPGMFILHADYTESLSTIAH